MPSKTYETKPLIKDVGSLGFIEGLTLLSDGEEKLHYFGGLPYALPPVGPFRFRRPRPLAPCYRYGHRASPARFNCSAAVCPQPRWLGRQDKSAWDENCLQLNIHIPAGQAPANGWPVFFFIHGGFLQWGNANTSPQAMVPLLSETSFQCIVVYPAYRLNAFGFLTSRELQDEAKMNHETFGNNGFWDQRLALEWTWKNISLFGGNQGLITIGGYSAGAHSTFQQLAHELYFVPDNKAIIKGAIMWSNSPGVQPKSVDEHQEQFNELLQALGIPASLSSEEKLSRLRATSAEDLVRVQDKLKLSEFRAVSDGHFISLDAIANINSGDFARRMKRRGIRLLNGENRDEHHLYEAWRTPVNSYEAVIERLCADFPKTVVHKIMPQYCQPRVLPTSLKHWPDLFGRIYADLQVHGLERGFHDALFRGGLVPGKDVFRYRFEKRMKCVDAVLPPEWEVTHATDMAIWWYGLDYGKGLTSEERNEIRPWVNAFAAFVKGEAVTWKASKVNEMQRFRADGTTDAWVDERWDEGLRLWNSVNASQVASSKSRL